MANYDVLNGNRAAAVAALLCRPDVIAAYPITPQTPVVEYLMQFAADGLLTSALCEVESELSAMSVLTGATLAGARSFTATSSQGLALMYEPYFRASTLRLPIVMAIVNREMISPQSVWGGQQDALTLRDAGWLQLYVEDNQEILDTIIQAFRLAEHPEVLLPVNICYDGFYLSHMAERVAIPSQEEVDTFLGVRQPSPVVLDTRHPIAVDPLTTGEYVMEYRHKQVQATRKALQVVQELNSSFAQSFGRDYGGCSESYRMEDAEYALVTIGSMTGAAREAVDLQRQLGQKVGLVKVRLLRPFPVQEVSQALAYLQGYAVIDRSVSFGRDSGILFQEVAAAMYTLGKYVPAQSYIGGLGGEDITVPMLQQVLAEIAAKPPEPTARWLQQEVD
ncbi:MAG: phenylglyoxylate dehydrogenase [Symbiobacteriaceae bacterium]|nr:phenylglyoxylate dehydrogenase [Symbiobacteriaceae bacterium]